MYAHLWLLVLMADVLSPKYAVDKIWRNISLKQFYDLSKVFLNFIITLSVCNMFL